MKLHMALEDRSERVKAVHAVCKDAIALSQSVSDKYPKEWDRTTWYPSAIDRFWGLISPEPNSGCWIFLGAKASFGHTRIRAGKKNWFAHRFSYVLHYGPIPKRMSILHKCDNPACVNPDHLFIGTRADNIHDMDRKGRRRQVRGEKCSFAKLSADQVRHIRRKEMRQMAYAAHYGISQSVISDIQRGKIWGSVK